MAADQHWIAVTPFLMKGLNKFLSEIHELPADLKERNPPRDEGDEKKE